MSTCPISAEREAGARSPTDEDTEAELVPNHPGLPVITDDLSISPNR